MSHRLAFVELANGEESALVETTPPGKKLVLYSVHASASSNNGPAKVRISADFGGPGLCELGAGFLANPRRDFGEAGVDVTEHGPRLVAQATGEGSPVLVDAAYDFEDLVAVPNPPEGTPTPAPATEVATGTRRGR